ncbi:alpha/beta hydrolase [Sphaerisporangium corydalis]|uniref:Alpha/beta hydrolase fold domain-containing protein n=1 Tax=Sphaerisporangium corydalis TaxID=1441875 RepID=A0ABV9EFB2_9ACTN|nr:alpha/beta hydrolase [Sphaerisporangium corydalis]
MGSLALAAVLLVPSAALPAGATASSTPTPTPVPTEDALAATVVRTYSYGRESARQRMDVWWQPNAGRRPGVFVIHGGWWNSGDKKPMAEVTRLYAEMGYTVFNINYRLAQEAAWPAQRDDTLAAISAARRHADYFSFDPDRYVIIGFSAGGHIATSVGTYKDGIPGLRGVVGVSPVVSPLTAYSDGDEGADYDQRKLRQAAIALAGGCRPTGPCARVWSSMEVPWHASAHDAPMLTVHSKDEFVPAYQSELLKEQLNQVGVAMNIRIVPGINHSMLLYREPGVATGIQEWVAGKLAAPAPKAQGQKAGSRLPGLRKVGAR